MSDRREHWESVHTNRDPLTVSWHQEDPSLSLELIRAVAPDRSVHIVDIGGGSSRVVDGLLHHGYGDVTVLDIAPTALARSRARLGDLALDVEWVEGDILGHRFDRPVDVWHDRAVFHFFTAHEDRRRYLDAAEAAMTPGGRMIIASFAPNGPEQCSGLPVQRYSPESMSATLGARFEPVRYEYEAHRTPAGATQHFLYGVFAFSGGTGARR